jgi:hypothetical protein
VSSNGRDSLLLLCYAFAAIVTALFVLTFWRLGTHSVAAAGQWVFVWLWTVPSPAFYAWQIRRRALGLAAPLPSDSIDTLHRVAWQIVMAGSLAALGVVSLVREYVQR